MKFSVNWLRRYLSTDLNVYEISNKLTAIGLEVEHIEDPSVIFKNFKLVRIKDAQKHPKADRLKVCVVEDAEGNESRIVCGAENARVGLKTILAMPEAIIPASGEILRKSIIREIVSEGMMCSPEELSLVGQKGGIIELEPNIDLSTSVAEVLGYDSETLDVSVTPNRGDCFSVKGIARDLAAAGAGKFLISEDIVCASSFEFPLNIHYENSVLCCKYAPHVAFRIIRGVRNGESPKWLKSTIRAAGFNSISMLVDLSNFWMVDSGRPTHVYDLGKIKGAVSLRFAKSKEVFEDIKGNRHQLLPDMLVAADEESPLCLMGVMGGKRTACDENTTDILVESGLFDQISVSKTGTMLNISSESRVRFERGIDKNSCVSGLEGITELILKNCGGEASAICIVGKQPDSYKEVTLEKDKLNSISGSSIDWNASKLLLEKLGLKETKSDKSRATFSIPSWRSDLSIEEDLVEEVLRLKGYDSIVPQCIDIVPTGKDEIIERKNQIVGMKRLLASRGLSEIITYSFIKQNYSEVFEEDRSLIHLLNPISTDLGVMRSSLLPALLLSAKKFLDYGSTDVSIFEVGNVFYGSCEQELQMTGIRIGNIHSRNWLEKSRVADIFDVKGDLFSILNYCNMDDRNIITLNKAPSYYHPSRSGAILFGHNEIGYFGELHPKINKLFDFSEKIVCFEVLLQKLLWSQARKSYINGKIFPKIHRDFAFLFASKTSIGNAVNAIYELDPLITEVSIFDCFESSIIQKSIGISVTLEAVDRTLTEDEAQVVSKKVIKYMESIGGELRKK
ncbi:MAG: phenylalanine--tRNA ligase subunit beta [Holosporaceae bacterium]|jgi:phenylalanyl-tRNA synthetase beta chain|nr:phenylalanine--tRNA ligase subunit beta [Holosporaceae bacterium]